MESKNSALSRKIIVAEITHPPVMTATSRLVVTLHDSVLFFDSICMICVIYRYNFCAPEKIFNKFL